jgi:peptidyl-prolyl cis-trans isomerase A (cyclophilin A)
VTTGVRELSRSSLGRASVALLVMAMMAPVSPLDAAAPPKRRPAVTKPQTPPAALVFVALKTSLGEIQLELDRAHAPKTTANFLRYVDERRLDGVSFYRVMRLGVDAAGAPQGLIQAGPRGDFKRVLKPVVHEPTTQTGLRHVAGAVSMARFAPGTATGDFSILLSPMPALDADPAAAGDNAGYAVFGRVTAGLDVVRKIYDAPLSPTLGEGILKGQMIAAPVKIITVRRTPAPPWVVHVDPAPPVQ